MRIPGAASPAGLVAPSDSTTRSFGHFSRIAPAGKPGDRLGRFGHRERDERGEAPDPRRLEPGRTEPERQQQGGAGRSGPRPILAPATCGLFVRDGEADLGRPVGQPAAHDVVGRADDGEVFPAREEVGHGWAAQPAAATSIGSGRSSSNASCSARSAVSSSSSAIMQVIRTSEVEIISMFTPASASVPNIRAA